MSGHEHLSEDALLDAVYGIAGSAAEAHLRRCADCAQRLQEWHEKRAAAVESVENIEISGEFLAAQRRKIYERIERPSRKHWLWAPGLAAACALAIGVFVYHPAPKEQPRRNAEISDAQLFGEVYSMEQSLEPAAAAPARALFEEQQ
jgi:hypothetical protein